MTLQKVNLEEAKKSAEKMGLKPAVVKGTEILRFMKKESPNLEPIDWDKFGAILQKNKIAVYSNGNWMKVMKEK